MWRNAMRGHSVTKGEFGLKLGLKTESQAEENMTINNAREIKKLCSERQHIYSTLHGSAVNIIYIAIT